MAARPGTGRHTVATRVAAALAGVPAVVAAVLVAGVLAALLPASTAAAGTEYRYWSYWQAGAGSGGDWTYAPVGPGGARPPDGAVEGWRFLVSADGEGAPPRGTSDFATLCRDTPEREGRKRVGVVLDYGTAADAPDGARPPQPRESCASVPEDASGSEVLAAAAEPRFDRDGFVCALDGYPDAGCGDPVRAASSDDGDVGAAGDAASGDGGPAGTSGEDGGPPVGLLVGVGLVALLGGGALWRARGARGR
jgi:hypothetical protein